MPTLVFFFFQAEDGIRDLTVTGVALPICIWPFPFERWLRARAQASVRVSSTSHAETGTSVEPNRAGVRQACRNTHATLRLASTGSGTMPSATSYSAPPCRRYSRSSAWRSRLVAMRATSDASGTSGFPAVSQGSLVRTTFTLGGGDCFADLRKRARHLKRVESGFG